MRARLARRGPRGRGRPRRADDRREPRERRQRHPPRRRARGRRRHVALARAARDGGAPLARALDRRSGCARRAPRGARGGPRCARLRVWPLLPFQLWRRSAEDLARSSAPLSPTRPRRGSAASPRAAGRPAGGRGRRGSRRGSRAPSPPACRRRCRDRTGPTIRVELLLRDARLEQPLAAPLLVAARAERTDVERLGLERGDQRRLVELVVVGQHDDRRLVVGRDLGDRLLRPLRRSAGRPTGIRSGVRNVARASATIAVQPSSFAPRHSASAVSTAP